ncbi:MAG: glycosyltransferase family 2 protein [Saprospiraceae bacterium]|nr:glycosyltransferase family 2 protein [Saprospiraceae bacterium]
MNPIIDIIIPAYNEASSVGLVIKAIPMEMVREIVVCDNASTDDTSEVAINAGATVVKQPRKGYGSACLAGMDHLKRKQVPPDIVAFLDADFSDHPEELPALVDPIIKKNMDLVIGSRALGNVEEGAMMPQQVFGNWLATNLIRLFYGYHFTDLGPFRTIRYSALLDLDMQDPDFGWTVEMQIKAAKQKLKCIEVPVNYRRRIGVSKVSGTIKGTILAGHKILWTIFKLW